MDTEVEGWVLSSQWVLALSSRADSPRKYSGILSKCKSQHKTLCFFVFLFCSTVSPRMCSNLLRVTTHPLCHIYILPRTCLLLPDTIFIIAHLNQHKHGMSYSFTFHTPTINFTYCQSLHHTRYDCPSRSQQRKYLGKWVGGRQESTTRQKTCHCISGCQ